MPHCQKWHSVPNLGIFASWTHRLLPAAQRTVCRDGLLVKESALVVVSGSSCRRCCASSVRGDGALPLTRTQDPRALASLRQMWTQQRCCKVQARGGVVARQMWSLQRPRSVRRIRPLDPTGGGQGERRGNLQVARSGTQQRAGRADLRWGGSEGRS